MKPRLFRYTRSCFLEQFLDGEVRFASLATYRAYEHTAIGDPQEGKFRIQGEAQVVRPSKGRRGKRRRALRAPPPPESFTVPGFFDSDALVAETYVFCTSRVRSIELALEFGDACVEITDVDAFTSRLREKIAKTLPYDVLLDGPVEYHPEGAKDPTGIVWAFPDRIAMRKRDRYRYQCEDRFLLGDRRALELHQPRPSFCPGDAPPPPGPAPTLAVPFRVVQIGDIRDITRPHRYWWITLRVAAAWRRLRKRFMTP